MPSGRRWEGFGRKDAVPPVMVEAKASLSADKGALGFRLSRVLKVHRLRMVIHSAIAIATQVLMYFRRPADAIQSFAKVVADSEAAAAAAGQAETANEEGR